MIKKDYLEDKLINVLVKCIHKADSMKIPEIPYIKTALIIYMIATSTLDSCSHNEYDIETEKNQARYSKTLE